RSADRREGHRGLGREIRHHRRTAEEPSGGAAGEMRGAGTYRCGWLAARTDRTLGLTFLSLLEVTASILRGRLVCGPPWIPQERLCPAPGAGLFLAASVGGLACSTRCFAAPLGAAAP